MWCLSRIGARKLFYGPDQSSDAGNDGHALDRSFAESSETQISKMDDAVVAIARRTGDSTRDLSPATIEMIRKRIPEALLPALEGEVEEDLGKVFGEELPSGLVTAAVTEVS